MKPRQPGLAKVPIPVKDESATAAQTSFARKRFSTLGKGTR